MTRFLGVDLAWGEGSGTRAANESGVVCIDDAGVVVDAGWATGVDEVARWVIAHASPGDVIAIDAPLVVHNASGMRLCEREVGQRYGRWQVSAYPSNLALPALGGVALRLVLEAAGLEYFDGVNPQSDDATIFFECYPHTTLVGAAELGYTDARPRYKKLDPALPVSERRASRASLADGLIARLAALSSAEPPLDLTTHPVTLALLEVPSPTKESAHKHREDLIDAAICAWTAAAWSHSGLERFQVLGATDVPDDHGRVPTLIAMARPEQRRAETVVPSAVAEQSPPAPFTPTPVPGAEDYPDEGHMNNTEYTSNAIDRGDTVEFVEGGAAQSKAGAEVDNGSTRAPSPAPTTVELLRSATWHLEHARVVGDADDVAFEAARSALAEAVFDLEHVQYGETTRG
ncbi:MAG TPA: DUF429 domain-containing protein [Plantibacter sp.]|uniref:DUF429 domain-containing protein n=1 Tax=unclassified Plantibacter TaxID=2624265 RepID=UPI002BE300C3|nr:DUF429 domain-containing protein [Plantibacter sp.]